MTIKEFSEKYNIPYNMAYNASYGVKPVSTVLRDRDYPEEELKKVLIYQLHWRITGLKEKQKKATQILKRLGE